ncbi:MAG: class I SAM-dependent methyltransferase [Candidatus Paceibacterota bacterium]|jgi:SAM-dependent methyltransferase
MIYKNKKELIGTLVNSKDTILDVGFWGQGQTIDNPKWPHRFILEKAGGAYTYGLDVDFDEGKLGKINDISHYKKGSAEDFQISLKFDVIFAADLIEHLSNPGLFLKSCRDNLKDGGSLVITTPNCFSLFNIAEKLTKTEPTVNSDHTMYFNSKTLRTLFAKNDWSIVSMDYLYSLDTGYVESWKKKFLNAIYHALSWYTPKYIETLVIVAKPDNLAKG